MCLCHTISLASQGTQNMSASKPRWHHITSLPHTLPPVALPLLPLSSKHIYIPKHTNKSIRTAHGSNPKSLLFLQESVLSFHVLIAILESGIFLNDSLFQPCYGMSQCLLITWRNYTQNCAHTLTNTETNTQTNTNILTHMHTYKYCHTHTHMHKHTHIHMQKYSHTHNHQNRKTHTHTHCTHATELALAILPYNLHQTLQNEIIIFDIHLFNRVASLLTGIIKSPTPSPT